MQIAVVGSGYVGLVAGACFADLGHQVIVVDNDQAKLAALKAGEVPIHEKFLPELLRRHRGHDLTFAKTAQPRHAALCAIWRQVAGRRPASPVNLNHRSRNYGREAALLSYIWPQ